jgi:DNA-binding phage protein
MKTKDFEINPQDVKILDDDFFGYYAKYLKENPAKLEHYKKHIVSEYNKTQDTGLFLQGLRIVSMAEGKVSSIAKQAKVGRTSMYRMLSKKANPSFINLVSIMKNLGITIKLQAV